MSPRRSTLILVILLHVTKEASEVQKQTVAVTSYYMVALGRKGFKVVTVLKFDARGCALHNHRAR